MHFPSIKPLVKYLPGFIIALLLSTGCQTSKQPVVESQSFFKLTENVHQWRLPTGEWEEVGDVRLKEGEETSFEIEEGSDVFVNNPTGKTVNLISHAQHGDVSLHVEFTVPQGSNSGVYLQGRYEVQVLDSWGNIDIGHGDCGGIYQRWVDGRGIEGHAPKINASLPPGEWQSFDIVFRAPRFNSDGIKVENARFINVVHNGVVVHKNVSLNGPTRSASYEGEQPLGPLMLQGDHGPVAYRNIIIRPLYLD
jgi:hypothetical protein